MNAIAELDRPLQSVFEVDDFSTPGGQLACPAHPDWVVTRGETEGAYSAPLTNEKYHAVHTHISHTGMIELLRSPAHYRAYLQRGDEERKGVNIGAGAHAAILEPDRFDDQYIAYKGRRVGKAWEQFAQEHAGKVICSEREMDVMRNIQRAVREFRDYPLWAILRSSYVEIEKSIFWIDEETGAGCRIRHDVISDEAIFDIKTIDDARPERVSKMVAWMQYDLQAAMYSEGERVFSGKTKPFIFVFIEDKPPHGIWVYPAGSSVIRNGMIKFRRGVKDFAAVQQSGAYPCYQNAVSTLELPNYLRIAEDIT